MFKYPDQVKSALSGAGCLRCGSDVTVHMTTERAFTECPKHKIAEYKPSDGAPHFEHIALVDFRFSMVQGEREISELYCPYCGRQSLTGDDSRVVCADCGASAQELSYL